MPSDIVAQRAKDVLRQAIFLSDGESLIFVHADRNAHIKSQLFLGDAGVVAELPEPQRERFSNAGLFALNVTDQKKLWELLCATHPDKSTKEFSTSSLVDMRDFPALYIEIPDLNAPSAHTLSDVKNFLGTLTQLAKQQGLSEREFRL